jgi:hypothetical protein
MADLAQFRGDAAPALLHTPLRRFPGADYRSRARTEGWGWTATAAVIEPYALEDDAALKDDAKELALGGEVCLFAPEPKLE